MNNIIENQNYTLRLIHNGPGFITENISLINKAKYYIILQTYIFEDDSTTKPLIEALIKKAKQDVHVYLLIDDYGSKDLPDATVNQMIRSGIQLRFFAPLFSRQFDHIGRRIHSKILVIDGNEALVGGINISKRFNNPENSLPWLDYACYMQGSEVARLIAKNLNLYNKYFPAFKKRHALSFSQFNYNPNSPVQVTVNDWMRLRNEIYRSYINAIKSSQTQIVIVATYFFPGKHFLKTLAKAASRGVRVDLIFSAQSDHPIERWSSKYLYSWFFSKNINIYEWSESIVHGKIALIDNNWVTIGSYNHNFLSRFGNHEVNLEISDYNFIISVQKEIELIKSKSNRITRDQWESQNKLLNRIYEFLSYVFANILTILSMMIVIRRKDDGDVNLIE